MTKSKILLKARLIVEEHGQILLLKQTSKNGGKFTLVGGTVEDNEFARKALIRESREESGIILNTRDLQLVHTLHKKKNAITRIVLYYKALQWTGDIQSQEPKKFKEVAWFPVDDLPKGMSDTVRHALKHYRRGSRYSEMST